MANMKWTPEKLAELRSRYPNESNDLLAKELGCTRKALAFRASNLGIKKSESYNEARYARLGKKEPEGTRGCPRRRIATNVLIYDGNKLIHYSDAGMSPHADALDDRSAIWMLTENQGVAPGPAIQIGEYGKRVGESHGRARLSDHEADLVRQLKLEGMPAREIAEKMEISKRYVYKLVNFERRVSIVVAIKCGKPQRSVIEEIGYFPIKTVQNISKQREITNAYY